MENAIDERKDESVDEKQQDEGDGVEEIALEVGVSIREEVGVSNQGTTE